MPKFLVEMNDGREFEVESDTQPTEQEITQFLGESTGGGEATEEQFLPAGERLSTGFRDKPEQFLEQRRAEAGLAPGTPLEPTGFNLENIKDFPLDVVDAIGPMFPAIGQILATGAAIGSGVGAAGFVAAGAAGSAGGELARQEVGRNVFGFEQGTAGERAGKVALEAGIGATGEVLGLGLNSLFRATKSGIVKAFSKLSNRRGVDKAVEVFGQVAPGIDPKVTQYAQNQLRAGDKRVLSNTIADDEFPFSFSRKMLFGGDVDKTDAFGVAKHLSRLSRQNPNSPKAVEVLAEAYLDLPKNITKHIVKRGGNLSREFVEPSSIIKLGQRVQAGVSKARKFLGPKATSARNQLAEQAGNLDVDLTNINSRLIELLPRELVNLTGDAVSINPGFVITSTGTKQVKIFGELIKEFFGDVGINQSTILKKTASLQGREIGSFIEALSQKTAGRSTSNSMKFSKFIDKLNKLEAQISGNEFEALGELSAPLAEYLSLLRKKVTEVGLKVKNNTLVEANERYGMIAGLQENLGISTSRRNLQNTENLLKSIVSKNPNQTRLLDSSTLDQELGKFGKSFMNDLMDYNAVQSLVKFNDSTFRNQAVGKLAKLMPRAFDDTGAARSAFELIEDNIDIGMSQPFKILDKARAHSAAKQLDEGAFSLLRGRFISSAIGGPAILGAVTGGAVGGPVAGTLGLVGGIAAQQPKLFRAMLKGTSKLDFSNLERIARGIAGTQFQVSPRAGAVLSQLLRSAGNA